MGLFVKYMPPTATVATVATLQITENLKTVVDVAAVAEDEKAFSPETIGPIFDQSLNDGQIFPAYCSITGAWCSSRLGISPCWSCKAAETVSPKNGD